MAMPSRPLKYHGRPLSAEVMIMVTCLNPLEPYDMLHDYQPHFSAQFAGGFTYLPSNFFSFQINHGLLCTPAVAEYIYMGEMVNHRLLDS